MDQSQLAILFYSSPPIFVLEFVLAVVAEWTRIASGLVLPRMRRKV